MAQLSVNVNKVATLRNSRGKDLPNVLEEAQKIIGFGGQGITVHPRPDGRHIRWPDVEALKSSIEVELNIEGYPGYDFMNRTLNIVPAQCTLVPDPPEVLTSNAGWRLQGNEELLQKSIDDLKDRGIRISLFVDPNEIEMEELLKMRDMGVDRVELYTEAYAEAFGTEDEATVLERYKNCAKVAHSSGLGVNAGHDLNLRNLKLFAESIPQLDEVSIGHALVCDALNYGWQETIRRYLACLQ